MRLLRNRAFWVLLGVAFLYGCAGLVPAQLEYQVVATPVLPEGRGDIFVDPEDSCVVFSKEGAMIKARLLTDDELNRRFPRSNDGHFVNPYSHSEKDPTRGYVPPRFAVFDVTIINETYAKIEFDPAKSVLITDDQEEYRYYDAGREGANPLGGNSFNKYYRIEAGRTGNELQLNMERRGLINRSIYHRHRPVFKGDQRTGLLVFDPLPGTTAEIRLVVNEFVLSFDANGNPEETVDVEFKFSIDQQVLELVDSGGA